MTKLPRRRSHSRNMQIALRRLYLLKKATDYSHESSTESDEEEKIIDDLFDISQTSTIKLREMIYGIFLNCLKIIININS